MADRLAVAGPLATLAAMVVTTLVAGGSAATIVGLVTLHLVAASVVIPVVARSLRAMTVGHGLRRAAYPSP